MIVFITLMFAALGAMLGSFANAWSVRLLGGKSIAKGRSECPKCKHNLAWYDNIPVVSYVILQGKCRYCKKPISIQYPLAELGSAILFAGLYLHFVPTTRCGWVMLALWCGLSIFLVAAFVTDWLELVLPDQFMIPAIVIGLVIALLSSYIPGLGLNYSTITARLIQTVIIIVFYCALYYGSKKRFIGDGDIRLAAVLGLALALPQLLVGVFAAYVIGATIGVVLIATKVKTRKDIIAFGPFLIVGLYFGLFFGMPIANWYLTFF